MPNANARNAGSTKAISIAEAPSRARYRRARKPLPRARIRVADASVELMRSFKVNAPFRQFGAIATALSVTGLEMPGQLKIVEYETEALTVT